MSVVGWAWIETVAVAILAGVAVAAGRWFSRRPQPWWLIGYVVPLLLIVTVISARRLVWLEFYAPFSWVMAGRVEFAVFAAACALLMTTLICRLPRRRERVLLSVLMVCCVAYQGLLVFLAPAFNHQALTALDTLIDGDGVCLQTTNYTCGPAAAVTALRRIGIEAEEGQVALGAHTTHLTGTQADVLCTVIRERYGVPCRQVYFGDIDTLRPVVPVIATVKFAFLIDHFVTVLEVTDAAVVVGDPLAGRIEMTRAEFAQRWRRTGIVLDKPTSRR